VNARFAEASRRLVEQSLEVGTDEARLNHSGHVAFVDGQQLVHVRAHDQHDPAGVRAGAQNRAGTGAVGDDRDRVFNAVGDDRRDVVLVPRVHHKVGNGAHVPRTQGQVLIDGLAVAEPDTRVVGVVDVVLPHDLHHRCPVCRIDTRPAVQRHGVVTL
jgi:hypothetical protein